MRKQNKTILWPIYFNRTKTRKQGRKVPKSLAIPHPKLEELQKAAEELGITPQTVPDASHPKMPWKKQGKIVIPKTATKMKILKKIAEQLKKIREKQEQHKTKRRH